MTDGKHTSYEARRRNRVAMEDLKRRMVFGLGVSSIVSIMGALYLFLVLDAWDSFWRAAMIAGWIGVLLAVVYPDAWSWPEYAFRKCTSALGHFIFSILLTLVYVVLVCPLGALFRRRKHGNSIYTWDGLPPTGWIGWSVREPERKVAHQTKRRATSLILQPFVILSFFVRRGRYVLLPVLLLLIILGLIFFFVQTSVLAPFIYTLF